MVYRIDLLTKHPHTRGENFRDTNKKEINLETSPHTWGERELEDFEESDYRNIPTHVGRTPCLCKDKALRKKHPHTRGENSSTCPSKNLPMETSPHTWGEH